MFLVICVRFSDISQEFYFQMTSLVQYVEGHNSKTFVCDNQFRAKKGTNIDTLLKNNMLVVEVIFYWEVFS
jgi:hypothetical protein